MQRLWLIALLMLSGFSAGVQGQTFEARVRIDGMG